ncbi:hypothetical protein GOV08_00975 [Candidatus Woesearchaeota archaeon]|nr:hypothetical protein [Candidatus Woesearchaeota archaeon]
MKDIFSIKKKNKEVAPSSQETINSEQAPNEEAKEVSDEKIDFEPPQELPDLASDMYPLNQEDIRKQVQPEKSFEGEEEQSSQAISSGEPENKEKAAEFPKLEKQEEPLEAPKPQAPTFEESIAALNKEPEESVPKKEIDLSPIQEGKKRIDVSKDKHPSFFNMMKKKSVKVEPEKIMEKMKDFHKEYEETEKSLQQRADLDARISDKLIELELLEQGWYFLRKEIETKNTLLTQKEKAIDQKLQELKGLMSEARDFDESQTISKRVFILSNGDKIESINQLQKRLKHMDDQTFQSHITGEKNDFSNWILHTFGNQKLAEKVALARTKEEMIHVLKQEN